MVTLADQTRCWLGGVEQTGLWVGGQRVWQGAPQPMTLSDYYGTGVGEIVSHWRFDEPVVSGTTVTRVPCHGGNGGLFDLTRTNSVVTTASRRGSYFSAHPAYANVADGVSVDALGVHVIATTYIDSQFARNFAGSASTRLVTKFNNNAFLLEVSGVGAPIYSAPVAQGVLFQKWALVEFRITPTGVHFWVNGAHSFAPATITAYPITGFGTSMASGRYAQFGSLGPVIGVVVDDADTIHPAIVLARQQLAAEYGIIMQ